MLRLSRLHFDQMRDHARAGGNNEICGVLVGEVVPRTVRAVVPGHNVAAAADHLFLLDAATLLRADREARAAGWELVGFYHSHPHGPPLPSPLDRAQMWPDVPHLIFAGADQGGAACGWLRHGSTLRPCLLWIEDLNGGAR